MIRYAIFILIFFSYAAGCTHDQYRKAKSHGELESGYTYIPLDAFSVNYSDCTNLQTIKQSDFFNLLPDNSIRTSIQQFDLKEGKLSFVPVTLSSSGYSYKVTADYINSDTVNMDVTVVRTAIYGTTRKYVVPFESLPNKDKDGALVDGSETYYVYGRKEFVQLQTKNTDENLQLVNLSCIPTQFMRSGMEPESIKPGQIPAHGDPIPFDLSIPVYVGVGLRVTANVISVKSGINVSGFAAISANVDTEYLQGTLTVQTLGVNGPEISAALPQNEELNRTTVRAAITSIAAIRAKLYQDNTIVQPRVLGIYLPVAADVKLINALVSHISQSPPDWTPIKVVVP